jgi:hypothetical protein
LGIFDRLLGKVRQKQADKSEFDDLWHQPIGQEIAIAVLRQIPDDWQSAYLLLEPTEKGFGTGLTHSAITRERSADLSVRDGEFVLPGMEVMAATRKLELGAIEHHMEFRRFLLSARFDGAQWGINTEFEYD